MAARSNEPSKLANMPRLCLVMLLLAAAWLQTASWPIVTRLHTQPNLLLVLIMLWTIARGAREGAVWAFGGGLLLDLVTLAPLGSHGLALLSVVGIGHLGRSPRWNIGLLPTMGTALVATLVHDTVLLILQGASLNLAPSLLRVSLLTGLLNLAATPLLSLLTTWLNGWLLEITERAGRPQPPRPANRR